MPAVIYASDKAIEFEATYIDTMDMINNLRSIDITGYDIDYAEKRVEEIKRKCEAELEGKLSKTYLEEVGVRALAEQIYANGMAELNTIQSDLQAYEVYVTSHYNVINFRNSMKSEDNNPEQIKAFSRAVITLLKQINGSNTRLYSTESGVVEELYSIAYIIAKKEVLLFNKSTIFDWVKGDKIATSFFNREIAKDINALLPNVSNKERLEVLIANSRKESLRSNYLNDALISYLVANDKSNLESVLQKLSDLAGDIQDKSSKIQALEESVSGHKKSQDNLTFRMLNNDILKTLGITLSCVATLVGLIFGGIKFCNSLGQTKTFYKTDKEIISTGEEIQTPNASYYAEKIDEKDLLILIEYMPWEEHHPYRASDYWGREVYTYDLSNVVCENDEDYLNIDYKVLCDRKEDNEKIYHELDVDRLYDEAILEVVRLSQSEEDFYEEKKEHPVVGTALGMFVWLVMWFLICARERGGNLVVPVFDNFQNLPHDYKTFMEDTKNRREIGQKLKKELEELKQLLKEDETLRSKFIELFNKYQDILPEGRDKKSYMALAREKKNRG